MTALASAADDVGRGEAEFGIAASLRITDDLVGATAALDRAQAKAEAADLPALASRCRHLRGNLLFPLGRVEECMQEHRAALGAGRARAVARAGGAGAGRACRRFLRPGPDAVGGRGAASAASRAARSAGAASVELANRPMAAIAECYMMRLDAVREMAEAARRMARQAHNRAPS